MQIGYVIFMSLSVAKDKHVSNPKTFHLQRKQIFITCQGEHPADREAIGDILVQPEGIPYYYYPYTNDKGYLSPLVSAKISKIPKHRLVNIECIAWADNIEYHGGDRNRMGSIHFEIMID